MKKIVLTITFATIASLSALAQGTIFMNTFNNTGVYQGNGGTPFDGSSGNPVYSSLVTSNGLIFTSNTASQAGGLGYGGGSKMLGVDVNFVLMGGATAGTVNNTVVSKIGAAQIAGDNGNWGQLGVAGTFSVGGTAGAGPGFFELFVWEGSATSYANAVAANAYVGDSGVFTSPMGGGVTQPAALSGLPDMMLAQVPEPSTFALAGLGAAALMVFRRRK